MAKLGFVLIALVALQGCYGASLQHPKLNDLEEVVEEFAVATKEVNEIISYIAGHLSSISRDYEYKISEIVQKHSFNPVAEQLIQTIRKLELETPATDVTEVCFEAAWGFSVAAIYELEKKVDNCLSDAHATGGHIKSILETVDGKATKIQAELVAGFHKCKEQGGTNQEAVKCLRDVIEPLKVDLANLKTEVNEAHEQVHKDVDDGARHLNMCLQHIKEDFTLKSDNIIADLEKCIKSDSFAKFAPRGILDFFKELREKIENIIHLVSHLPTSIEEIPDKINEIISHINISALYSQLKSEVHEIIKDGGRDAEKCRPEADQKLNEIVKAAEDAAKLCMGATEGKVEEVEAEFKALVGKAKQLLDDVNKQALDCVLENKLDPVAVVKCLESHADSFKERLSALQQNVVDTTENAKQQADDLLENLASCVNKVQLDTVKNGQALIGDVEKCVLNPNLLF